MTIADTWMGMGVVHRGEFAPLEGGLLYNTLKGFNPLHIWNYKDCVNINDIAPDEGSVNIDMVKSGTVSAITGGLFLGPSGDSYPSFGVQHTTPPVGHTYCITQSEILAAGYTTGFTLIIVMMPFDEQAPNSNPSTRITDAGTMFRLNQGSGITNAALDIIFFSGGRFGATTVRGSNLVADQAVQVSNTKQALWQIFEIYVPPGDSMPLIYKDGIQITGADLQNFNQGVRQDYGSGFGIIGSTTVGGLSSLAGYYAMCSIQQGAITPAQRTSYRSAGITEGWILPIAESFDIDGMDETGTISGGNYDQVLCIVAGVFQFFPGTNGDPDTIIGSSTGHAGAIQFMIDGIWTHIHPRGGPFNDFYNNPGHVYYFDFDPGVLNNFQVRCGDSLYSDNAGGWVCHVVDMS